MYKCTSNSFKTNHTTIVSLLTRSWAALSLTRAEREPFTRRQALMPRALSPAFPLPRYFLRKGLTKVPRREFTLKQAQVDLEFSILQLHPEKWDYIPNLPGILPHFFFV